jgi:hypothetical protein
VGSGRQREEEKRKGSDDCWAAGPHGWVGLTGFGGPAGYLRKRAGPSQVLKLLNLVLKIV